MSETSGGGNSIPNDISQTNSGQSFPSSATEVEQDHRKSVEKIHAGRGKTKTASAFADYSAESDRPKSVAGPSNSRSFHFNPGAAEFVPGRELGLPPAANQQHQQHNQQRKDLQPHIRNQEIPAGKIKRSRADRKDMKDESEESLRMRLSEQLEAETYECMICCDRILIPHWTWSCQKCFHVFHLRCTKKWASKSLKEEEIWRCPGCQNTNLTCPNEYLCFCGKVPNPRFRRGDNTPHACSEACMKDREGGCTHKCTLPCHPGPCPPCPRNIRIKCNCGNREKTVRCGSIEEFKCGKVCGKVLNCQIHECPVACHKDDCQSCKERVKQVCFCEKKERSVPCTVSNREIQGYSCGEICSKDLPCGNHFCQKPCHTGSCAELCPLDPKILENCPCGKVSLKDLSAKPREICSDPVPVCPNICGKLLLCSSGDENPLLCERRCKKQRTCRMHKCGNVCCVDREHMCFQICGKPLNCGQHFCDQLCHSGKCPPCLQASFTELYCECGLSVLHPPVPCGTRLPHCDNLCTREHACGHPVTHKCHSETECPPCTYLISKWCYGHHELRRNIPCYLDDVSCGKPCGKRLKCRGHFCMKPCHPGECMKEEEKCKFACKKPRSECGHPCNALCHEGECPETVCKSKVKVTCKCGYRKGEMTCAALEKQWSRQVAVKAMGGSGSDIGTLQRCESTEKYKSLECTEECGRIERNRKLAEALNLGNVDLVGDRTPVYTDFLKTMCTESRALVLAVEKSLVELVQSLDQMKISTKSHVFQPMNRDHRRVIHEYAEYFQVDTVAYDPEPQRNVVATAKKGLSCVPSLLLSAVIQQNAKPVMKVAPPPHVNPWSLEQSDGTANGKNENKLQSLHSGAAVVKR